jgi:hypothetical protein
MNQNEQTLVGLIAELKEKVLFLRVTTILFQLPPPQTSLFESKTKPASSGSVKHNSRKLVQEIVCEDQLEDIVNSGANITNAA